jgi:succinate-semialdehyde dehydrogenase/glutarate-semialdehyde dehydrogenase
MRKKIMLGVSSKIGAITPQRGERASELGYEQALFVNGKWQRSADCRIFEVRDPSTDDCLARLPSAGSGEAVLAIEAAKQAFASWSRRSVLERADLLLRVAQLIAEFREPLAQLAVLEQGMPLAAGRSGVDYAGSFFRWYAEEARRIYGRTIAHPDPNRRLFVEHVPRGVACLITPWNAPLSSPAKKAAAALAAGCTIVLKPSEMTPLSALALAWLTQKAEFPPGVFNVVFGDAPAIGRALVRHPDVRTISFTGSLATGRRLYVAAARQIKHVTLELGGNAPFIIFEDAEVDRAVDDLVWLKQANSGQICVTANRVLIQESIFQHVEQRLQEQYGTLLVGDGFADGVQQGPLISPQAVDRIDTLVRSATDAGGRVLCGARRLSLGPNFYPPTLLSSLPLQSRILHEEIFGPVLPLISFRSDSDAIATANCTENRLSAFAYTSNLSRATRCSRELDFGVVGINDPRPITCEAPFGGVRQSGIGREGGTEGLMDFLDSRLVSFNQ